MTKKRCIDVRRRTGGGTRQIITQSITYSALAMFLVPGISAAASFNISGTSHTQQTLGDSETGVVQAGATLAVSGTAAVLATGNALSLTNEGSIQGSPMGVAVASGGNLQTLTNSGTLAGYSAALVSAGPLAGDIHNTGTIEAGGPAIFLNTGSASSPGLTGNIINHGTIQSQSASGVLVLGGVNGNLENWGKIQSGATDGVFDGGDWTGDIANHGTIQATGTGIDIAGAMNGNITNSGTIKAGSTAVRLEGDLNGTLTNGYAIAASGTGIYLGGAYNVENFGLIQGATAIAGNTSATAAGGKSGLLVNAGEIKGNVNLGAQNDTVVAAGGAIEGNVDGGGGTNTLVFQASQFQTLGSFSKFQGVIFKSGTTVVDTPIDTTTTAAATATVLPGATLDLTNGGNIHAGGAGFGNQGTVIADGGTISGNFGNAGPTGAGTLQIPIEGTNHGTLNVTGGADLSSGTVEATVKGQHYVPDGSTYSSVVTTGAGLVPPGSVKDNSAVLSFSDSVNGTNLDLTAHRVATYSQLTGGNRLAAKLDAIGAGGVTPGSNTDHLLGQLDAQPSGAALTRTVDSLGSRSSGSVVEASRLQGDELGMTVEQHMLERMQLSQSGATGMSAGDSYLSSGVWVQGFLGYADQNGNMRNGGYTAHTAGGVIGADTALMPGLRVGLAYSNARTNVDGRDAAAGERLRMHTDQVTLYGSLVPASRWYVDAQLGWALHRNDSMRTVALGGQTAMGAYDTHQYSVRAEVGRSFGTGVTLTPLARVRYSHLDSQGYTETGASPYNLKVASQSSNYGTAGLGVRVSGQVSKYLEPEASLAYRRAFGDVNQSTSAELVSTNTTFSTRGYQTRKNIGVLGLGMTIFDGDNLTLRMQYELDKASGYTAHNGALKLRLLF